MNNFLIEENNNNTGDSEDIMNFMLPFKKVLQEAKQKYNAIFICELNTNNKKIDTKEEKINRLLSIFKLLIINNDRYQYLLDKNKDIRIFNLRKGYQIPVLKEDLNEMLNLLQKANDELKGEIRFFIEESHLSPWADLSLCKVQIQNLPPECTEKELSIFGEIESLTERKGITTVLYKKLVWFLPYTYHQHIQKKLQGRWFEVHGIQFSFASKIPCQRCGIKGHHQRCCPGESLTSKLKKEKDTKQPKNNINPKSTNPNNQKLDNNKVKPNLPPSSVNNNSPTKSPVKKKKKKTN